MVGHSSITAVELVSQPGAQHSALVVVASLLLRARETHVAQTTPPWLSLVRFTLAGMIPFWLWSYLLTALGIVGIWLAGRKSRKGWAVGLGAQVLWIAYASATHQFGFYVSSVAYGSVYARNYLRWRREAAAPDPAPIPHR